MAVDERCGAHLLGDEWDIAGDYILVDRVDADGYYGAYVGQAPAGLRSRLGNHNGNHPNDETLPVYERIALEACAVPVSRELRLLGYSVDSPGEAKPAQSGRCPHTHHTESPLPS